MPATTHPPRPARATLVWAVRLLLAEAVALGLFAIFLAYEGLTAAPDSGRGALAITLFAALLAALLGAFGRALSQRRSWARGPAIVLQLLLLPIGYSTMTGGLWWLGLVLIAVGLCGAGTLLAPATRAALGMR
jgi:hypothetical protein